MTKKVTVNGEYSYWKTIKKGLFFGAITFLSGLVVVWQDDIKYAAMIPVITMVINYLKHRKD